VEKLDRGGDVLGEVHLDLDALARTSADDRSYSRPRRTRSSDMMGRTVGHPALGPTPHPLGDLPTPRPGVEARDLWRGYSIACAREPNEPRSRST